MKSFFIFLAGFICGIIFIIFVGIANTDSNDGLVIFPEKGECFHTNKIKVFQVIKPDMALAHIGAAFSGTLVLLVNENNKYYYDDEIVSVPKDKCARQIGTYQYETKNKTLKTVPVVNIE